MRTEDEMEVFRLNEAWNEAYRRRNRSPLIDILADDFAGLTPMGEPITKASLLVDPPGTVIQCFSASRPCTSSATPPLGTAAIS